MLQCLQGNNNFLSSSTDCNPTDPFAQHICVHNKNIIKQNTVDLQVLRFSQQPR